MPTRGPLGFLPHKVMPYRRYWLVIGVVIFAVYLASIVFYSRTLPTVITPEGQPPNGVAVYVVMNEARLATDRLSVDLVIYLGEELLDVTGPVPVAAQDVTVRVEVVLGRTDFTIARGEPVPLIASTTLYMSGAPYTYPFDNYFSRVLIDAKQVTEQGQVTPLPAIAQFLVPEGFVGWRISYMYPASESLTPEAIAAIFEEPPVTGRVQDVPRVLEGQNWGILELHRSWSTIGISILILVLMVLLTTLSLLTSRSVLNGKKELNIGMAGFLAALLFAMPALRNLLPGAPPIGSWIDILIFFWVEIAVMISLASFVLYWWRKAPPPKKEEAAQETTDAGAEAPEEGAKAPVEAAKAT